MRVMRIAVGNGPAGWHRHYYGIRGEIVRTRRVPDTTIRVVSIAMFSNDVSPVDEPLCTRFPKAPSTLPWAMSFRLSER